MTDELTYSVATASGAPVFRIEAFDGDYSRHLQGRHSFAEQVFLFEVTDGAGYEQEADQRWQSDAVAGSYAWEFTPADIYDAAQTLNLKYRLLECLIGYSFPIIPSDAKAKGVDAFGLRIPYKYPERVKNFPKNYDRESWYTPDIPDADVQAIRNTIRLFCAFAEQRAGLRAVGPSRLGAAGRSFGIPCLEQLDYEQLFYCLAWSAAYVFDAAYNNPTASPTFAGQTTQTQGYAQVQTSLDYASRASEEALRLQGRTTHIFGPWTYPRANARRWSYGPAASVESGNGMWCPNNVEKEFEDFDTRNYGAYARGMPAGAMATPQVVRRVVLTGCNSHLRNTIELDGSNTAHCPNGCF